MLHLLTDEYKQKIVREYQRRAWIVFAMGIIAVVLISALFMVPVYIITYSRYSEATGIKKALDRDIAMREDVTTAQNIKDISASLSALSMFKDNNIPTVYIEKITAMKPVGVRIRRIVFTPSEGSETAMDISGTAKTRSSLVMFADNLKKDTEFGNVNVPISNFAKDSNIDFSIKILIKKYATQ